MGENNTESDNAWRQRYDAAHGELEDATRLALNQRLIDACDPLAPPTAHIFTHTAIARQARRVCMLAGSFNPLTVAHVALAEAARGVAQLDVMIWACTAITIDKERVARASLPDRLGQLNAYVEHGSSPGGNLLALLNRGLYVDQADAIRPRVGPNAELFILVGFDKIVQIFDPHYYLDREMALNALFAKAKLLVGPRGAAGEPELQALLARPENSPYREHVRFIPVAPEYAEESSTESRAVAAREDSAGSEALRRLVTPEGMALIGTGAYVPVAANADVNVPNENDTSDAYLWRQIWIRTLARAPAPNSWHDVPPLSTLVAYTLTRERRAAQIRSALVHAIEAPPENVGRLLRAALTKMR